MYSITPYIFYINNCPTSCNTKQSIYYSQSSLYIFRVSTTTIIRSTQNCKYSLRYWSYFLNSTSLQRGTPGSRSQPKLRGTNGTWDDTGNPLFWVNRETRGDTGNPEIQVTFQMTPEARSSGRLREHVFEGESGDQ